MVNPSSIMSQLTFQSFWIKSSNSYSFFFKTWPSIFRYRWKEIVRKIKLSFASSWVVVADADGCLLFAKKSTYETIARGRFASLGNIALTFGFKWSFLKDVVFFCSIGAKWYIVPMLTLINVDPFPGSTEPLGTFRNLPLSFFSKMFYIFKYCRLLYYKEGLLE